ncbi:aminotransferase class V-fold PLP-dependent enzyme, partial [Escherichia coli]|uniref:aminotransferase class V-fold PLP-dependent enzyme n=1 Tax=Escherichia coli TaxID=562 RepID=UPI0010CAE956
KRASLFINARSAEELVFVRGPTDGFNLVATTSGPRPLPAGDHILLRPLSPPAPLVPAPLRCTRRPPPRRGTAARPGRTARRYGVTRRAE